MSEIKFEYSNDLNDAASKAIHQGLVAFNESKVEKSLKRDIIICAKNSEGQIIGGVKAEAHRGWLYIAQIWVADGYRDQSLGTNLINLVEAEGKKHNCFAVYLSTFSFQALDYYKKLGFEKFGELKDFPKGHSRIFLSKVFTT